MFIGVYALQGMAVHEEAFDSRRGESMSHALASGIAMARRIANQGVSAATRPTASGWTPPG